MNSAFVCDVETFFLRSHFYCCLLWLCGLGSAFVLGECVMGRAVNIASIRPIVIDFRTALCDT